jgi:predicted ABC-type ATPase
MMGYETRLIFAALDNPETAIRRRFFRGLRNFFEMYRDEVDHWTLKDNSGDALKTVAMGEP